MGIAATSLPNPDIASARYHLEKAKDMMSCLKSNSESINEV